MKGCKINKILQLKTKYKEIKSITIDYKNNLIIKMTFYDPENLKIGLFTYIIQTIIEASNGYKYNYTVGQKPNENYLLFLITE